MLNLDQTSRLYFECHVTIDPIVGAPRTAEFDDICRRHKFQPAKLLMHKFGAELEVSNKDAFCTGRHPELRVLHDRMRALIVDLKSAEFVIRRFKIEDTLLDSKHGDV